MTVQEAETLKIRPLDGPLGAIVEGLDASRQLSGSALSLLSEAWREHLVLVAHGQSLDDNQLVAFSKRFGELDPPGPNPYGISFLPDHPELNVISNVVEDGLPIGNLGDGEAVWHADLTYIDVPPMGAILYALEIPPSGGDTHFANMFMAYEELPDRLKLRIAGRVAVHDAAHNSAGMLRKGYVEVSDVRQTPGARHPLVRTEPGSGRRCLFLGRRPHAYIVGLEVQESEDLLDELWAHVSQPRFAMSHRWQAGDLLMWQNLSVLHRRDAFDPASRRIMHRAQIKGRERIE